MQNVSVQDLVRKVGSVYKLVILASRRTVELNDGAAPLVSAGPAGSKFSNMALREIADGKVTLKVITKEK